MIRIQQAASLCVLGYFITLDFLLPPSFAWAQSRLETVIKAAQQEGALTVNAPASLSAPERVEFVRTFLKKYGLKIDVQIDPSGGSMVRKIANIAQEIAVGQPPTWDVLVSDLPPMLGAFSQSPILESWA